MSCFIRQLSTDDDVDVYQMLKRIGPYENSFSNPVFNMTYSQYKNWLKIQDEWNNEKNLPKGYVRQTIFWFYANNRPIGIGKIRYSLTLESRKNGGNIGYAIDPLYRGNGYGTIFLEMLLKKAKLCSINEIILTIDKGNDASRAVVEKNGGKLFDKNNERWYFTF